MYKGQLKGLPAEVVRKMLERQYEQTAEKDVSIFENNLFADKKQGGFDWNKTIEGGNWWASVVYYRKFTKFFERYPKQQTKPLNMATTKKNHRVEIPANLHKRYQSKVKKSGKSMRATTLSLISNFVKS